MPAEQHMPVMLNEVVAGLNPSAHETYIDGTFGAGGYSTAILDKAACTVIAIDRDRTAFEKAEGLKQKYDGRLIPLHGCFGDAEGLLQQTEYSAVDGFILDLGVSSMQLDQAERGFSFRFDAPLDMRMDQKADVPTAADIVNGWPEKELADGIYKYGEERHSRRVARAIVARRAEEPITTTGRLADIIRAVIPKKRHDEIDPATRTFQALRIIVNDELQELEKALDCAERILKKDGRLVIVSFHSLEDKIVKHFMRERAGLSSGRSRYLPEKEQKAATFFLPSKKAVLPSEEEIAKNPRSRSARMRVAIRTQAPAWSLSQEKHL